MSGFGAVVRQSGKCLPLIGLTGLAGTAVTLALPAVLGRAVDAIVAGHGIGTGGSGRWLAVAAGLLAVGVGTELISVYAGTACVAGTTAWLRNAVVLRNRNFPLLRDGRGKRRSRHSRVKLPGTRSRPAPG